MLQNGPDKNSGLFDRSFLDSDGAMLCRRADPDVGADLLHRVESVGHEVLCPLLWVARPGGGMRGQGEVDHSARVPGSRHSHQHNLQGSDATL